MAAATYPPAGGSPIKSIQRGTAVSAGTVTISSIDTSKSFVTSFSNGSSGTVAIDGTTTSGTLSPSGGVMPVPGPNYCRTNTNWPSYVGTRTMSGGTTNLTTATHGAVVTNSTTITVTGACNWQVVEYN